MTSDTDTITLKDAARKNGYTVSALKAEHGRGRLTIYKIGKRLYTTPADIRRLERAIAPRGRPNNKPLADLLFVPDGVYVVGFADYVKIGWSSQIPMRLDEIQRGIPETLTIYAHMGGDVATERRLHHRFAAYRLNGEWFRLDGDLADWIKAGCPV